MTSIIQPPYPVLFVCLGNICRSPMAEGVFRAHVRQRGLAGDVIIDSAGTGGWHVGSPPDARAVAASNARGIDISALRARQVGPDDFASGGLILACDRENLTALKRNAGRDSACSIELLCDYSAELKGRDIPDPYYGDARGFDVVLDMLEAAALGLADDLLEKLGRSQ